MLPASVMIEKFAVVRGEASSEFLDLNHTRNYSNLVSLVIAKHAPDPAAHSGALRNRDTSSRPMPLVRRQLGLYWDCQTWQCRAPAAGTCLRGIRGRGTPPPRLSVGKNVVLAETGQIELGARAQEPESGLRERRPALPRQHGVELGLEGVQMQHVGGRVGELLLG